DSIRSGDTQRASWVFDANIPFEVEFEIRYSSPGITAPQHASARFACGPKASGNVAPPGVNSVSAEPSATALQPGDSFIVLYEVTGPTTFRDSLPNARPGASGYWSVQIPVRQEWTGTPTFSVYIRDAAGLMSARGSSKPDSLRIYPRVTPPDDDDDGADRRS